MVGLTYPGHAYQLSDEEVVRRWEENPYYQYFCREEYFRHQFPIDASSLRRALAAEVRQPQPPGLPGLIGLADDT